MSRLATALVVALISAVGLVPGAAAAAPPAEEPLVLRVDDVIAVPGGLAAVVLRTYASRGIGQGQLCLVGGPSLDQLEEAIVFSTADDAATQVTFDPSTDTAELAFSSPSGTVNAVDGPLAVLFFRVAAGAAPGSAEPLRLAVDCLVFQDGSGTPVTIQPRDGELTLRDDDEPVSLEADGDSVAPGGLVDLAVTTSESLPLSRATLTVTYDPSLSSALPDVLVDPRHGEGTVSVTNPQPGVVRIVIDSPDASLNVVPGALAILRMRVDLSLPVGSLHTISLDAAGTELLDALGAPLDLDLGDDVVEIVEAEAMFDDDFESGDLTGWCVSVP